MANFTCFEFHNSLNIENHNLTEWLERAVNSKTTSAEKWDRPGFFPHVILERRYELLPKKLTGYVQFDVDSGKYIKSFESREVLMSAAWMIPSCHLVAHSFSNMAFGG